MHAHSHSPAVEPATEVWSRLAGIYGGEALLRRFGEKPPEEWRALLNRLPPYKLDRAFRRLVASGKPHVPTLPEFMRAAELVGDPNDPAPPPSGFAIEGPRMDPWALVGNRHLMAYVYAHAPMFRGPDCGEITAILVRAKNTWVETMRETIEEDREDGGKGIWTVLMRQAEAEISKQRARAVS